MSARRCTRRAGRDDRGAVAILFAVLAVVLLGVGALAVDLGQAYAKKSLLQTDVDIAVMAAVAELDQEAGCNAEVVSAAEDYLTRAGNAVPGQYPIDLDGAPGDQDGFIRCPGDWKVELWAPRSEVPLGLGRVLSDDDSFDVAARAAAQVRSPAAGAVLPFFGVQGCDYGAQTIRDDSGGSATAAPVPALNPDSSTHNKAEFSLSPTSAPEGTSSMTLTLSGKFLGKADGVGFTGAGGPPHHHVAAPATTSPNTISVPVPAAVLSVPDAWYVRVLEAGEWSEQHEAQRFTVGEDKLYCDTSLEGNFGTIDIPRSDTKSFVLEHNIIRGVEPTLALHPSPAGECGGKPGSVESTSTPVDGTNCLASEPGLKISATNAGLVSGKGGLPGRLDRDSTNRCSRGGTNARTSATVLGRNINDDLLSCYVVNGAHLSDLVAGNAVGTAALSADIFASPRFFWIPVVDTDPSTGKKSWPVVAFRPGFITDQSLAATRSAPGTISALNGLVTEPSGIREVRVVLFSQDALPPTAPAVGDEVDYTGSGTKVLVLVE
ncbi:TadE/TadG family type IV pilus assembly protein [Nocardioides sp. OK12]|uniref:TadE/TadG family type IV pilus assembly protein n=1 Tax=Nocardioides sp. OK12 TaxID=2758661 RepID=UPI0021C3FA88|nr:TadE/TadG family type IV pilus assembly protein [Nocardioides sp. OK12]